MSDTFDDEGRIRALITRAAYLGDHGEPEQYAEIYTQGGIWEFGDQRQQGVETIIAAVKERRSNGIGGPTSNSKHVVVPMDVQFSSSEEATVISYLTFWKNVDAEPVAALVSTYTDTVRREPEGWRISHRLIKQG